MIALLFFAAITEMRKRHKFYAYGACFLGLAITTSIRSTLYLMQHQYPEDINEATLPLQLLHDRYNEQEFEIIEDEAIMVRDPLDWDKSPVVIEEMKLLFFTLPKVACTSFKMLFRRIMGETNWKSQDYSLYLPHNPDQNNLTYLYDYNATFAKNIFLDPTWTKAIFVREPKKRFLSAFLDKAVSNSEYH